MGLLDKVAKKTFMSEKIQQSWRVHMQMFGPILAPAFVDDYVTRTNLCAALNYISNRDLEKGIKKLQPLQAKCKTDADRVAWLFFMGLIFDMAGVEEGMMDCYGEAAEIGHRFYLPYLKLAKSAHNHGAFEPAEKHYLTAIDCLREGEVNEQTKLVLASAYINYASCLTMLHRFEDAAAAVAESEAIMPVFPGRSGTVAVLRAVVGDWEAADEALAALQNEAPPLHEPTAKEIEKIRKGEHPHFFTKTIDPEAIAGFWAWFAGHEDWIVESMAQKQYDELFAELQPQLKAVVPFLEAEPEVALRSLDDGYEIHLADCYMTALEDGYRRLLDARPADLKRHWEFVIEH